MASVKETPKKRKVGDGTPGPGRPKGSPNKTTSLVKEAIILAATKAGGGGKDGMVKYLTAQALDNPKAFLPLIGRVLPLEVSGGDGGPLTVVVRKYAGD